MRAFLTATCLGGVLFYGAASWAATPTTVEPVKGDLLINHGNGFEKVSNKIEVKVGNSVMVNPGGIGKVTYADGCQANVKPGAVTTIARLSPCASGSLAADMEPHPMYTKAVAAPAAEPGWGYWPILVLAGAGAGIGCAIACTSSSTGSVATPTP